MFWLIRFRALFRLLVREYFLKAIVVNSQLANIVQSATVAINQKVKILRDEGKDIVHFGFGQSPFPVHPKLQEALCKNAHHKSYLPTLGLPELRQSISKHLKQNLGYDYDWKNIVIGPGSKQLLFQATAVLEGPLLLPAPSWVSYGPQAEILGKHIIDIQSTRENDYKITADQIDNLCGGLDHRQKILIINSPNNPTGSLYSEKEIQKIAKVCRKNHVIILSDEIYGQICFEGNAVPGFSKFAPELSIVTGGLSKGLSAGGWRLGFLAAPKGMEHVVDALGVMTSETYTSVSSPIQYASITAYEDKDVYKYSQECTRIHKLTSEYLYQRFQSMKLNCPKAEGAFYLFPDFENFKQALHKMKIKSSNRLANFLLDELQIAVLPGNAFYWPSEKLACRVATVDYDGEKVLKAYRSKPPSDTQSNIRFIEKNCPNLKKGCDRLEAFLKKLK